MLAIGVSEACSNAIILSDTGTMTGRRYSTRRKCDILPSALTEVRVNE
jgi:hypothetical protein